MGEMERLLHASEQLYSHLENTPLEEERTQFIDEMNVVRCTGRNNSQIR